MTDRMLLRNARQMVGEYTSGRARSCGMYNGSQGKTGRITRIRSSSPYGPRAGRFLSSIQYHHPLPLGGRSTFGQVNSGRIRFTVSSRYLSVGTVGPVYIVTV